ncbi:hypothetical protein BGZ80_000584 [Entomortierella chlamydospora]|uniref:Uncharacterized protein n=1 Tax=Entomortierella chlamydospora TaxID=101097 RepID=A0A9P6SYI1_9FUNG|nr:hypothetical protein BGZ79_006585 [Entomortierella chlamydospora]KAG0011584.1 hypothetical protein BGZ80_000584 [Entomortierella chlamydospora]
MVSFFNYPELCHELAANLSRRDVTACLRVNRELYSIFLPYLYQSITISNYTQYFPRLLEELQSTGCEPAKKSQKAPAESITDNVQQTSSIPLTSLRSYGHMVETLTIHFKEDIKFGRSRSYRDGFLDSQVGSPETYPGEEQTEVFVKILQSCPFYKVKTLEIRGRHPKYISRPFLYQCGTAFGRHSAETVLQQTRDRSLARIIMAAAAAVDAGTKLDLTTTSSATNTKEQSRGIRRINVSDSSSFGKHSLQAITDTSLLLTLEELDVQCCGYIRSEEMHFALSKLPNLKVADFRCRDKSLALSPYSGLLPKKLTDEEKLVYRCTSPSLITAAKDRIPTVPPALWACRGSLRSLRIGVTDASLEVANANIEGLNQGYRQWICNAEIYWIKDHPDVEKPYPEQLLWFFDQIAILTQLRELCLVTVKPMFHQTRSLELSLKTGLARWSTLTALECLDVEELDHKIELEDVQWMAGNWPALKMIRGLIHEKDEIPSAAVVWLKRSRPDIKLPVTK